MSRRSTSVKRKTVVESHATLTTATSTTTTSALPTLKAEEKVNIMRPYFPSFCICDCDPCKLSGPFHTDDKPHWYGDGRMTGYILKGTLLRFVKSDQEFCRLKSCSILTDILMKRKKEDEELQGVKDSVVQSDIMLLQSCGELEMFQLMRVEKMTPLSKKLVDLASTVILWAWKCSFISYEYFKVSMMAILVDSSGRIPSKLPREVFDLYASPAKLLAFFFDMAGHLLVASLEESHLETLRTLDELNYRYNSPLAHVYMDDKCIFTWAESYFYNFCNIYKGLWLQSPDEYFENLVFIQPTVVKGRLTLLGIPKQPVISTEACAICSNSKFVGTKKLHSIIFALSRDVTKFPREIATIAECTSEFKKAKEKAAESDLSEEDVKSMKSIHKVITVCGMNCVLEAERVKHQGLDTFLTRFQTMVMRDLVKIKRQKWSKQDAKKFEIELTECQRLLSEVETVPLKQFVLIGMPVKLEVKAMDDGRLNLFADVDVLGSRTYQVICNMKETTFLDELSKFHNINPESGMSKAADAKYWEVNDMDTTLFSKIEIPEVAAILQSNLDNLICLQEQDCKHEALATVSFLFRGRWASVSKSLNFFAQSDFNAKLNVKVAICSDLEQFQGHPDHIQDLKKAFQPNSSFCFIPLCNGYVDTFDIVNGLKFVISDKADVELMKPYLSKSDFLFFIGDMNLEEKTCSGGLLFMSGPVIIGILLKDVYNFLMDFSSLEKFLNLYTIYESNKFQLEEVLLKIDTSSRTRNSTMKNHGVGEWKFGLLKLEFFRETRKHQRKHKLPLISLPQIVYHVTVRLNVPLMDTLACHSNVTNSAKIVWTYQCLGSVPIEQALTAFQHNWDSLSRRATKRFKFFYDKPFYGTVSQSDLVSKCKTDKGKDETTEIKILAEFLPKTDLFDYSCTLPQIWMSECFIIFRVSLLREDCNVTYKLLVPSDQCFADVLEVVGMDLSKKPMLFLDILKTGEATHKIPLSATPDNISQFLGPRASPEINLIGVENTDLQQSLISNSQTPDILNFQRHHVLSVRDDLGDEHFRLCQETHQMLWHSQLIPEFDDSPHSKPSFFDLLISSCQGLGHNKNIFPSCGVKFVLGATISNPELLGKIIGSGIITRSSLFLASISPKICATRRQDSTPALLEYVQSSPGSLLLLAIRTKEEFTTSADISAAFVRAGIAVPDGYNLARLESYCAHLSFSADRLVSEFMANLSIKSPAERGFTNESLSEFTATRTNSQKKDNSTTMYAFLKPTKHKSALILIVPWKMNDLTMILEEEKKILEKFESMTSAIEDSVTFGSCVKTGSSMSCLVAERLEMIHLTLFKFSDDPPISRHESEGPEGLIVACSPQDAKNKDLWKSLKSHSFIEFYDCPWPSRSNKIVWSEDKQFIIRFDNQEVLKKCREAGRGLATSYCALIDPLRRLVDRRLTNHVLFAWQFDKTSGQVVAMLPPKKQQIKILTQLISSTKWLEKYNSGSCTAPPAQVTKEASKPTANKEEIIVEEDEEKTLNQKRRFLSILDQALIVAPDAGSTVEIFEYSPCLRCHSTKKKMFICTKCLRAHFCSLACYKRVAEKHEVTCCFTQSKRNLTFIETIRL